ncbi:SAP30-binding protein [Diaphorina citri]|uniref:SAP30-binding protein n=1 Tax=Diaphorina citri TaxID=121845 RepID=A0A3Q0IJ64_DIACI|nr:SAP30-binding protein [Diaphorina citri]
MADKTEALQALTATYTDSEEEEDEKSEPIQNDTSSVIVNLTMGQVEEQQRQKAVAKLVSYYHDENDMVISDDDEEKENSMNTSAEPTPTEEKQVEMTPADKDDIQLPPEPPGRCSQELQDKITRLYERMQATGMNMNQVIQKRKDFRNPSIYEKLIQFCGINELGTNYDASMYDPLRWGKESYYEELAKAQKEEMDKRNKEQKEKTKVEIVVGTAKKPAGGTATVIKASGIAVSAEDKNRKSKWDQVAGNTSLGSVLPAAPLTTTVTGTKGTVISAFGSLPKKTKTSHS